VANEITAASVNDVTTGTVIETVLLSALSEQGSLLMLPREFNLTGRPGNTLTIPILDSYWGTPGDRGAGVDTEFNATEAVEISNTPVTTSNLSISAAEYGIAHEITDNVDEDLVQGIDLLGAITGNMVNILYLAMADDFVALFAGLSTSVGSTGVDFSLANFLAARTSLVTSGINAPDGLTAVLDNQQASDVEGALLTTNAAAAVYAMAADRFINFQPSATGGMAGANRMSLFNIPVHTTGLTDTANTGADVVGAIFVASSAANDPHATFAQVWKRRPRFETERHAKKRTTDLVMTTRWGVGEMRDLSGVKIVTDAP
jgi:hypothetical protein